jgi:cytidylate kinase
MTISANLDRYADALQRAQQHWQARRREAARVGPPPGSWSLSIALMREAGAPGTSLAHEVGKRLGWPVYDHQLLELIAKEMGLRVNLLESVDERRQGWLQEAFQDFAEVPQVTENGYVRHLVETILSLGALGHCVIVGRASAQILPAPSTLRVRLIGDVKDRIAGAARRRGLTPAHAARWVEDTDRERTRFVQDHFLKDSTDPRQYDLILNISRWTLDECACLVVQAAHCLEARVAAG